jgi:hypothetical protein
MSGNRFLVDDVPLPSAPSAATSQATESKGPAKRVIAPPPAKRSGARAAGAAAAKPTPARAGFRPAAIPAVLDASSIPPPDMDPPSLNAAPPVKRDSIIPGPPSSVPPAHRDSIIPPPPDDDSLDVVRAIAAAPRSAEHVVHVRDRKHEEDAPLLTDDGYSTAGSTDGGTMSRRRMGSSDSHVTFTSQASMSSNGSRHGMKRSTTIYSVADDPDYWNDRIHSMKSSKSALDVNFVGVQPDTVAFKRLVRRQTSINALRVHHAMDKTPFQFHRLLFSLQIAFFLGLDYLLLMGFMQSKQNSCERPLPIWLLLSALTHIVLAFTLCGFFVCSQMPHERKVFIEDAGSDGDDDDNAEMQTQVERPAMYKCGVSALVALSIIFVAWFCIGNYWVYMTDKDKCDTNLYTLAFWYCISVYGWLTLHGLAASIRALCFRNNESTV